MAKTINIGIIGLGTIGSGTYEIIKKNSDLIEKRTGIKINIVATCTRTRQKAESLNIDMDTFSTDYKEIISNPDIDIIVELIGGYEPARTIILESIQNKKHVVTANKAVMSKYGFEIMKKAQENNVNILFEAAVGGCIPIIRTIEETYNGDKITEIFGIFNGTTNFMLTKMSEGISYEQALKQAQDLDFAEGDPTFDVEGYDSNQKLMISASLTFDTEVSEEPMCEGITKITKQDMLYADELGYTIKLICIGRKKDGKIELRTHPTMIPKGHVLAGVNNEYDAFLFSGDYIDEVLLSGKGAGKFPTASVVVSDIIELGSRTRLAERHFDKCSIIPSDDIESKYYLRFSLIDKPGIFFNIAKIMGENNISISGVQQKEVFYDETNKDKPVTVILITHKAKEGDIKKAIKECNQLNIVKDDIVMIRVDELI